ncbi:MAG TPA: hypothetical protein VFK32_02990 [Tepidiformaceae bacterium]|nr:hypothetical protein [Tepidiformaceae bacterium]
MPRPYLSARQQHILDLVAAGRTNGEIATLLEVSLSEVKAELSGALTALEMTREDAARSWRPRARRASLGLRGNPGIPPFALAGIGAVIVLLGGAAIVSVNGGPATPPTAPATPRGIAASFVPTPRVDPTLDVLLRARPDEFTGARIEGIAGSAWDGATIDLTTDAGQALVGEILAWVDDAPFIIPEGNLGQPPEVTFAFDGHPPFRLSPAWTCQDEAHGYACTPLDGYVILRTPHAGYELRSPELREWLQGGYEDDFAKPMGSD